MLDIVDFLKARLDEDEAALAMPSFIARSLPEGWGGRALREVEAKRAIIENLHAGDLICLRPSVRILRCLALPYQDHPDYDPAWRPS